MALMTLSAKTESEIEKPIEATLPRRDWIWLPLLSLLTIGALCGSFNWMARQSSPMPTTSGIGSCLVSSPTSAGVRGKPNSVCWDGSTESGPIEFRFNRCGHRSGIECGTRTPGTYRIVMVGSSVALGVSVPREKTFAALLPAALSRAAGRKVELYNEGMLWEFPRFVPQYFNEVLAADPSLILWILTPNDIEAESPDSRLWKPSRKTGFWAKTKYQIKDAFATKAIPDAMRYLLTQGVDQFRSTPSGTLLQHLLYDRQGQQATNYLRGGVETGYLLAQPDAEWQSRLRKFDGDVAQTVRRAKAAGVPLAAVFVPSLAQDSMISQGNWPAGYDPYRLDEEVRSVITSHGGTYIDLLPGWRTIPNPEQYYFLVDGHPNAQGHATLSRLLTAQLSSGAIPALRAMTRPPTDRERGR